MLNHDLATPFNVGDQRAAPEIVAAQYGFKLNYCDTPEGRFYAVQDWIKGVASLPDLTTASRFWSAMKRRLEKVGINVSTYCTKLDYLATDNKTYKRDYTDSGTLYFITQYMSKQTGIVASILTGKTQRKIETAFVYLIGLSDFPHLFKIGIASDMTKRLENINSHIPFNIYIKHCVKVDQYKNLEKHLHRLFAKKRIKGEWFSLETEDVSLAIKIMNDDTCKLLQKH